MKAIKKYTGGIHGLVQAAVREDGVLFKRYQDKTPYGYRWGAWKREGVLDVANLPSELSSGFSTLRPVTVCRDFGCRLPKN